MTDRDAPHRHCELHFVGSVPLDDARAVLRELGSRFGRHLRRIPDGETGERTNWVQYQGPVFAAHPDFEAVPAERDWRNPLAPAGARLEVQYRPRAGVDAAALRFGELGYARHALASHAEFRALKAAGTIPASCRFMVALPSPYNVMSWGIAPDARLAVERPYQKKLLEEIDRVCAAIPPEELAIQWDCAHDMQAFDGTRQTWFEPAREEIIARLVKIGNRIPPGVELGYHFCYGSFGGRHFVEPKSTEPMVELANGILGAIGRAVDWIHLPVPIERDDEAYFAPLVKLARPRGMIVFLGLIHDRDAVAGTLRRIAAAEKFLSDFGLSTECGFGRRPREYVNQILAVHEQVLRECCPEGPAG